MATNGQHCLAPTLNEQKLMFYTMQNINLSVLSKLNTTIVLRCQADIKKFYEIERYYEKYSDTDFFYPMSRYQLFEYNNPKFLYNTWATWEYTLADLADKYLKKTTNGDTWKTLIIGIKRTKNFVKNCKDHLMICISRSKQFKDKPILIRACCHRIICERWQRALLLYFLFSKEENNMINNVRLRNIFKAAMLVDKRFCIRIDSGEYIRIRDVGRHTHTKAILTICRYTWLVK